MARSIGFFRTSPSTHSNLASNCCFPKVPVSDGKKEFGQARPSEHYEIRPEVSMELCTGHPVASAKCEVGQCPPIGGLECPTRLLAMLAPPSEMEDVKRNRRHCYCECEGPGQSFRHLTGEQSSHLGKHSLGRNRRGGAPAGQALLSMAANQVLGL
jgi:hypothetical protein